MTAAAGLENFRMYDLRHHAITVMLENPSVSEETVEAVAGHVSKAMQRRYSYVRMTARRVAVSAIDGSSSPFFAPEPPRLKETNQRTGYPGLHGNCGGMAQLRPRCGDRRGEDQKSQAAELRVRYLNRKS